MIDVEMHTITSKMAHQDDSQIILSRSHLGLSHLRSNPTRTLADMENVIPSLPSDRRTSDLTFVSKRMFSNDPDSVPQVGYAVKIPECAKGHGCKHACQTMKIRSKDSNSDSCYVEQKYDGQRMQIHVNLALPLDKQVKIFSKDRHESTKKREEIIPYHL
jgi:hypothetical protein